MLFGHTRNWSYEPLDFGGVVILEYPVDEARPVDFKGHS